MPTRDENIVERPIVPYNPAQANVRNRDVYNLYAPVAGPNKVGMAGYNPKDFRVDDQVVSLSDAIKSGYIYRVDVGPNTTLPEGVRYTVDGIKTPNNLYYNYTNQVIKSDSLTEKETVTGALFVFHSLINDISYIQTEVFSANGETWTRALNITNDEVTNIGDFIVTSKYYSNLSKQYAEASAESAEQSANSAQAAAQSAQAAAQSAQAAANSAQAAADNVKAAQDNVVAAQEAAAASAQHAGTSAQYATQSAQSATESAQYAQDSADSAELARKYAELGIQPNTDYNSYSELPRTGSTKFIYLIPAEDGTENDNYNEYIWVPAKNDYEYIGSTRIDLSNYAQKDGTYSGMTVGKATQADNAATATDSEKLGGVLADEYTLKTGTYPDMTVGNATNAENAEHATSADSATDAQAAAQADKLAAARTMQVNLASSNAAEFDGTENVTPGVTGILPVENGGTGANSLADVTVGNAQKLGNVDVSQYAQKTGMYPNMTVGNAQFANSLANSLYVKQPATGWYKIAEFTITGSNYNVLSTIILVNGIYGTQTSGDVEESGLLEFDIRKKPEGISSTECYLSILAGNLRADRFAFNISSNILGDTACLYWYQDFEYSAVKFTILDSKAENDNECSYKLVTIPNGGFPTGGEYAHNVAKAESDSAGNSISGTYAKKSAFNTSSTHITSFLSGVSGWGDIYLSGKLGICTFSISLSSRVNAWTDKYIFNWSTIPAMYKPVTGTVFGFLSCDSNDAWMQAGICACDGTGIKINGQSHTLDSGRTLVGTLVYIAYGSI